MRCVITGATGCLGMSLTKRLVQDGHQVIALGRNQHLGTLLELTGAKFIKLDLQEKNRLKILAQEADVIFHCAALSSPWGRYNEFYQSNVLGTQHVIDATGKNTRLVHVSSPSIYFDFTEKYQIKEDSEIPRQAVNHYVKSKLLAEALVDKAFKEQNLNVVTIRPRAIFGPYDRSILPRLMKTEKRGVLPIIGSGNNRIDITYVDNVVESLILAATASNTVCGKKYNITNDESMSLIEIITLLYEAFNKPLKIKHISYNFARRLAYILELIHSFPGMGEPKLTQYGCGVLALGHTLNIDAAKQDLNYKPLLSIAEGMRQFAHWYQTQ